MPCIVVISPKGGTGKTTTSFLLADRLADKARVTLIDGDPNRPLKSWAEGGNAPKNLRIVADVDEDNIVDVIQEGVATTPFTIVDLEGTASELVLFAVSQADLVLVPCQGSHLDAEQAKRAVHVIRKMGQTSRPARSIPFAVVFTRTAVAVKNRSYKALREMILSAHVPSLKTELNEREAFRAVFSFKQRLANLDPALVANIGKAQANVDALVREVLALLKDTAEAPTVSQRAA